WDWAARGREERRAFPWPGIQPPPGGLCAGGARHGTCDVRLNSADETRDGVRGMLANVAEWTSSTGKPGEYLVAGDDWYASPRYASFYTASMPPDSIAPTIGFRCAYDLKQA